MKFFKPRGAVTTSVARRAFIWKLGAGVSAAGAASVSLAEPAPADDAALRAGLLEDEKALRQLHQSFENALDSGRHDALIALFTEDAQVHFNGGVFRHRQGVTRLFGGHFPTRKTGRRMEAAPGFALPAAQQRDSVQVAADRRTATAVFPYSIQAGLPLESDTSLVSMARLHGEGIRTWWEGGVYRASYRREDAGRWLISRLEYDTLVRADYRPGRSYAQPIEVPRLAVRFPQDALGPDLLT